IELQATTLTLEVGVKQTLTATILPSDAENKTISWKSSDESIAEVSFSGEVTPIAAGTTTITATAADGEKTASCSVTVKEEEEEEEEENEEQKDPEEEVKGIQPVPVSEIDDKVVAFFDEYKGMIANSIPLNQKSDCFILINSRKKLPLINDLQYPTIDFDAYTLVIGQWIGGGALYLMSQSLVVENGKKATMKLIIGEKKEEEVDYDHGIYPVPFWGLYPKFEAKSLYTNVTYKN
ncbi:MAG: Ig-like domain-containing protein, partial [Tannerellaceae bacterium]|nr:Ig-like domain-containing protein [Tannerellaceae bacterium]